MELDFRTFAVILEKNMKTHNQERRVLHYSESDKDYKLFIKSVDHWKYFTKILKKDIIEFGSQYGASPEKALRDFELNFLWNAIPIMDNSIVAKEIKGVMKKEVNQEAQEEAKDYVSFLKKEFKSWESQVLSMVDKTLTDEMIVKDVKKTFGEFLSRMFNIINTSGFLDKLNRVIRIKVNEGVEEAEKELNINIDLSPQLNQDVESVAKRQLDGFMIDGKPWIGLKGVTEELQAEIRQNVVDGIEQKKGLKGVKEDLQETFRKYTGTEESEGRIMKIARTESNRIQNAGKLRAYKDSGITGKKVWDAFHDDRTSPICERLDGQEVGLHDQFVDVETGKEFDIPPAHVNCRSVIRFEPI